MAIKKAVEVEQLLRWAYRDELPKGYDRAEGYVPVASVAPIWRMGDLGTKIDQWATEPGFPAAMGTAPHPDALQVEAAAKRLPDVGLDWRASRAPLMGHLAPYVPLDHPALSHVSFQTKALVMMHARMGTRPEWDLGPAKLSGINAGNNKAVVQYLDDDDRLVSGLTPGGRYGRAARCPLRLDPPAAEIAFARGEYAAWHAGLRMVAAMLESWGMTEHRATPPLIPAEPWKPGQGPKGRILRAL